MAIPGYADEYKLSVLLSADNSIVIKIFESDANEQGLGGLSNDALISPVIKIPQAVWNTLLTNVGTGSLASTQAGTASTEYPVQGALFLVAGLMSPKALV